MIPPTEYETAAFENVALDYQYVAGSSDRLLVHFHGSVNTKRWALPFFKFMYPRCQSHQISIADPTIARFDGIPASWYLGWQEADLTKAIQALVRQISEMHGLTTRVYIGGSSGGFAALHHAALDPGSLALVYNPQTDLSTHAYPATTNALIEKAWPDETPLMEVCSLYAEPRDVGVVYLQSPGDPHHLFDQAAQFLKDLHPENRRRCVFMTPFEGKMGHGGSISIKETVGAWTRLLDNAPSFLAEDLLKLHYEKVMSPAAVSAPAEPAEAVPADDIALAERVRDALLSTSDNRN